ncbi:hypothetical protein [Paludisphaera rhizosphaerae]|uniref:hypothetical protein n=1 Tax=Paludisphaera rhizosphaerae TaxID=2711216 RepID=UPI0013EC0D82|nr:hypothetical protein [Paludisphaera rhizosphaerae]
MKDLVTLEAFGGTGDNHILDYAARVASLEIWEIDPACEPILRRKAPTAKILITDSIAQLHRTQSRYDFIIFDNPMADYNDHKYCEHFDLFPGVFEVAADEAVLALSVVTRPTPLSRRRAPHLFNEVHLRRRREFYGTSTPDDVGFDEMARTYHRLAEAAGFHVDWWFGLERSIAHFIVMKIRRSCAAVE